MRELLLGSGPGRDPASWLRARAGNFRPGRRYVSDRRALLAGRVTARTADGTVRLALAHLLADSSAYVVFRTRSARSPP